MTKAAPIAPEIQHLALPITDVKLWPKNPRRGDVGALAESLKRFGQVRPILVQKSTMQVVAGNHLLRAASALGWTEIAAVVMEMDAKQAKGFIAADNRMSELGDFDDALLLNLLTDIAKNDSLVGTGYDEDDLQDLLQRVGTGGSGQGFGDPDAPKDIPAEPWVHFGQMFQIGPHRLICGDGADVPTLNRLLGDQEPSLLIVTPGKDDDPTGLVGFFDGIKEQLWFNPWSYGLFASDPRLASKGSWLVWDKQSENTSREYGDGFEMIWSREPHKQDILRFTFVGASDGERHGGPDFSERPTAMFQEIYERWSLFEGVVCDPFSVGGTSLLAAEKSGRIYLGAKKSPAFVQALLEKWTEFSGIEPVEIEG